MPKPHEMKTVSTGFTRHVWPAAVTAIPVLGLLLLGCDVGLAATRLGGVDRQPARAHRCLPEMLAAVVMSEVDTLQVPAITKDTTPSRITPWPRSTRDQASAPLGAATAVPFNPAGGDPLIGRSLFNGTCAHCHGADAVTGDSRVNLELLKARYADRMDETFYQTVTHGRVEKGMPNWSGVFSDQQFKSILVWLHTVQVKS